MYHRKYLLHTVIIFICLVLMNSSAESRTASSSLSKGVLSERMNRVTEAILRDFDDFAPSGELVSLYRREAGKKFRVSVPDTSDKLAAEIYRRIEQKGSRLVTKSTLDEFAQRSYKFPNPKIQSIQDWDNRAKFDYTINMIYHTPGIEDKLTLFKELESIVHEIVMNESSESSDVLNRQSRAEYRVFEKAVMSGDRKTALTMYRRLRYLGSRAFDVVNIMGTAEGMVTAELIFSLAPLLGAVDFNLTLEEAKIAAEKYNTPTYEAHIYFRIIEKDVLREKRLIPDSILERYLQEGDRMLASFRPADESEQLMQSDAARHRQVAAVMFQHRNDRFVIYRALIENELIRRNTVFTDFYPKDPESLVKESSLDYFVDRMMEIDRDRTLDYVENRLVPNLEKFQYKNSFDEISVNKTRILIYVSRILRERNPELSRKLADQALLLTEKFDDSYQAEMMKQDAVANIIWFYRDNRDQIYRIFEQAGIERKEIRNVLIKHEPEIALEMGLENLHPGSILELAFSLTDKNLSRGITFFDSYLQANPETFYDKTLGERGPEVYSAVFTASLVFNNPDIAITRAEKIQDTNLRLITLYYIFTGLQ